MTTKVMALHRLSPNRLAVAGSDNRITLWDLDQRRITETLSGHTGSVAALDAEQGLLASGGYDTSIRVWAIESAADTVSRAPTPHASTIGVAVTPE